MEFHSKVYADGKGPTYGYSPEGCLSRRSWARGKTTDCTYDAWGNVLDESVSIPALATIRYRFQGREWSAATGLVNFRMRWYDSETGRWLSKDPIGLGGGMNLYAFCGNDAVNNIDPWGLAVWNKSFHVVWVKPDDNILDECGNVKFSSTNAYPVLPGMSWSYPQDGIAIPRIYPGKVFKNVDDVDITIDANDKIHWTTSSHWVKGNVGMVFLGGEKGSSWLKELHSKRDHGWDKLFEKSNLWLRWSKRGIPRGGIPLLKHPGHEHLF